jgi:hypothetical protein
MRKIIMLAAAMSALSIGAAHAGSITDPKGDLAAGFTEAANADLDVTNFSVSYNSTTKDFTFVGTMAGNINTAGTGVYAIGVETNPATAHDPFAQAPGVFFNSVIGLSESGKVTVGGDPLTASISGRTFTLVVPLANLGTSTLKPTQYAFNLWPENASRQISDFAPNNATLTAVPEPGAWALMMVGLGAVGFGMRRSRRAQLQPAAV